MKFLYIFLKIELKCVDFLKDKCSNIYCYNHFLDDKEVNKELRY